MSAKTINAVAPVRICDVGGWTDTWFAGSGTVFNIAVYPYVEVQIQMVTDSGSAERVCIEAENYNLRYSVDPSRIVYNKHPLIEAAIDVMELPADVAFRINIFSHAPPGASIGTSAAVSVSLVGALDQLTAGRLTPKEVAARIHALV